MCPNYIIGSILQFQVGLMEEKNFLSSRLSEVLILKKLIGQFDNVRNFVSLVVFPLAFLGFLYGYLNDTFLVSSTINGSLFFIYLIALAGFKKGNAFFKSFAGLIIIILTLNLTIQLGAIPEKTLILFVILSFIAFIGQIPLTLATLAVFIAYIWFEPEFSFGYIQESYYQSEIFSIENHLILYAAFLAHTVMLFLIDFQMKIISKQAAVSVNSIDELGGQFKVRLKYAQEMSAGNLDYKPEILKGDAMLEALYELNQNLSENAKQEKRRNWSISGSAGMGDVLRKHVEDSDLLANVAIKYLVQYLNANQGSFFFVNKAGDEEGSFLELKGTYAYDRRKYIEKKIRFGQGMVGQVYLEKELVYMKAVPNDYVNITSGLGDANPTEIVISPLKVENEVVGVIEIASFNNFEDYQLEFLKTISETIGSALMSSKRNYETTRLLHESRQLTEEMKAQEEEMRQNLEELEATQEDLQRKTKDKDLFEEKLQSEQLFLRSVIDSVPEAVYVKDMDLKYILVNNLFCKLTGREKEDLLGNRGENLFPVDSPLYYKSDEKSFREKKTTTSRGYMDNPEGKSCEFQLTKNIFRGENNVEYLIGSVTTIEV